MKGLVPWPGLRQTLNMSKGPFWVHPLQPAHFRCCKHPLLFPLSSPAPQMPQPCSCSSPYLGQATCSTVPTDCGCLQCDLKACMPGPALEAGTMWLRSIYLLIFPTQLDAHVGQGSPAKHSTCSRINDHNNSLIDF